MNYVAFFKSKRDLETFTPQDIDLLSQHYGIRAKYNDRLWLLAITILSDKKYAQMIGPLPSVPLLSDINFDDNFKMIKDLGKGTSGVVMLAELKQDYKNLRRGEHVAIKLINIAKLTQQMLQDIHREVDILRDVSSLERGCNLHIVCYYDSFIVSTSRGKYFAIVTEYIPGEDLEKLIDKKTIFSDTRVLQFMKTLAGTLRFLHDQNIVHRDIKTGNIILDTTDDALKYIDFGFSCFTLTQHKYSCTEIPKGSPVNMAPEIWQMSLKILKNLPPNDLYKLYKKADVWSLGITFYELVFGVLPPELGEQVTVRGVSKAVMKTLSFPADFQGDPRLVEIIKGMLVKNPNDRSDIAQIVNELNKL